MFTFIPATKKEVIEILTEPRAYFKSYGKLYHRGDKVHIAKYNYLCKFKNTVVALLQVDEFSERCPRIHICVKTEFCKPNIIKAAGEAMIQLFECTEEFTNLIVTIPANAKHSLIASKKLGFKEIGRISNASIYRDETVDCILLTYNLKREI